MAVELQIEADVLRAILVRSIQARLRGKCLKPNGPAYIDHVDVGTAPVALHQVGAAVRLHVALDIFIVDRNAVLAAPNGIPQGATVPASALTIIFELAAAGPVVSLTAVGSQPQAPQDLLDAAAVPLALDLGKFTGKLGLPPPTASKVELVGGLVAIRFDSTGPGVSHLFAGQDWGLFIDEPAIEQLFADKIRKAIGARITSLDLEAHWRPAGGLPHVDVDYGGKPDLPPGFSADIEGTIGIDLSLTPTFQKSLHLAADYTLEIDAGDFSPDVVEEWIENIFVRPRIDVALFKALADIPLPDIPFGPARLVFASLVGVPPGMTFGGPVRLPPEPSRGVLQLSVTPLGLPHVIRLCTQTPSGPPPAAFPIHEVAVKGSAGLEGCGAVCDIEILSPGDWIRTHMTQPKFGPSGESQAIAFRIPAAAAPAIAAPVRLIVRTARGVRLVDLGVPPPIELDANGDVLNAVYSFIDDCLYYSPDSPLGLLWGGRRLTREIVDPPLEDPGWSQWLDAQPGIDVQLVTLSGLEPGELIRFRSRHHALDVTADRRGRAVVPVLLPLSSPFEGASLVRVNRRDIARRVGVRAVAFARESSLEAGRRHRLSTLADGRVIVAVDHGDDVRTYLVGRNGMPLLLSRESIADYSGEEMGAPNLAFASGEETELNPQPLPPREEGLDWQAPALVARLGLPGLDAIVTLPGFAAGPVAFAVIAGEGHLLLHRDRDGNVRVAGTVSGPIGPIETAAGWGLAESAGRLGLFRILRS